MRVGLCIPRNAEFEIRQIKGMKKLTAPDHWTWVDSLEELEAFDEFTGEKVYHDDVNGYVNHPQRSL